VFEALVTTTEKQKKCACCHTVKSRSQFNKERAHRDGRCSICKDCCRERRQAAKRRPKESVEEKRCRACGKVKTRDCFTKDIATRDGLDNRCRECRAEQREANRKIDRALPETKVCSRCGQTKRQQDFYREPSKKAGLSGICKECLRLHGRVTYVLRQADKAEETVRGPGINTWEQVGEAIREMAELQTEVNREKAQHKKTIDILKSDLARKLRPYIMKQSRYELMIEYFIKTHRQECKRLHRQFRFGSVSFSRNFIDVRLNVALAQERLGLP